MPGKLTYFLIILAPGFLFNLAVWILWKRLLQPRIRAIAATTIIVTAYWGAIDLVAIQRLGIWSFRAEHTSGLMALGLPLEEWTLFLVSGGFIVPLITLFLCKSKAREEH